MISGGVFTSLSSGPDNRNSPAAITADRAMDMMRVVANSRRRLRVSSAP